MYRFQDIKNNPILVSNLKIRATIIQSIRDFFITHNFLEVETPNLVSSLIPESYLEYFQTSLKNRVGKFENVFLTTSPESSLKKLLVAGIGNCFEITKSFRNTETDSVLHNPEFTILEWYRVNATYENVMQDCEDLLLYIKKQLHIKYPKKFSNDATITYKDKTIDLSKSWQRLSLTEAFKQYANLDLPSLLDEANMKEAVSKKGYNVSKETTWEELFNQVLLNEIEPHLGTEGKPTILFDYPTSEAALARKKPTDPRFAERFEFYVGALELGDCYTELTDPKEQEERFQKEQKLRKEKGKHEIKSDDEFIEALKEGLPSCSGIAVGLDRLVMLFTNTKSIQDVIWFPHPV